MNLGELDGAIKDLTETIRLHPSGNSYGSRALAWSRKKEYDKAIADFEEAFKFNPKSVPNYYNRGMVWNAIKEYEGHRGLLGGHAVESQENYGLQQPR